VNVDRSATRLTATLDNLSSRELQELTARAERWLERNAPASMFTRGASTSVIFVDITLRNIQHMLLGTTLALLLISACLVVALGSVKFGLLSLVPNLVPSVVAFGIWGLVDGRVNLGLSVVTGMTFGIVVDDTVHFLMKYLRGRREHGLSSEGAARFALESVGQAMVSTSVMLVAGFAILALSGFVVSSDMGKMTAMTIAIALAADLLLLPPLLIGFESLWSRMASPQGRPSGFGAGEAPLEVEVDR
jgi:predicted RND superfamily exporter protein